MCTLTWRVRRGILAVRFNRDELRRRRPGLPPAVFEHGGVPILCPRDGDFGGTWIGANAHGLVLALLNGDPEAARGDGPFVSRGLLLLDALAASSAEAAMATLRAVAPDRCQPFAAFVADRTLRPQVLSFAGGVFQQEDAPPLLASSSVAHAMAQAERQREYARVFGGGWPTDDGWAAFHSAHAPAPSALSVCMHREDAETVSSTALTVGPEEAVLEHHQGSPCRQGSYSRQALPLLLLR